MKKTGVERSSVKPQTVLDGQSKFSSIFMTKGVFNFFLSHFSIDILVTRSFPYKGTAIAGIMSKLIT